ncbi:MAG: hypothetical protein KAJ19_08950 [Gammaproteobacteria bacterium]|nr:hypothetical protein [Gammaproteobacteria bacterium]
MTDKKRPEIIVNLIPDTKEKRVPALLVLPGGVVFRVSFDEQSERVSLNHRGPMPILEGTIKEERDLHLWQENWLRDILEIAEIRKL